MSFAKTGTITVTTTAGGAATGYSDVGDLNGRVIELVYTKDDFDAGVTFAITGEETGKTLWSEAAVNASKTVCPRQPTHSTAGVASLYDTTDSEPVEDYLWVVNERIKWVVSAGGNAKSGTLRWVVA